MCIIMNIKTQKITMVQEKILFLSLNIFSKVTIPHGMQHITCMKYKHIHTKFFGNFYVIITTNFYQVQLVHDARVFKILQTTLIV